MEFTVVQGDIASESADALVNAAGTSLRMGSGVAGALREAAEGPIDEEARPGRVHQRVGRFRCDVALDDGELHTRG